MGTGRSGLARYVVDAVVLEGRSAREVAKAHGISKSWIYELIARYRDGGYQALEPRSKRPRSCKHSTPRETINAIVALRTQLHAEGHSNPRLPTPRANLTTSTISRDISPGCPETQQDADERTRTSTSLRTRRPERRASTNSATSACRGRDDIAPGSHVAQRSARPAQPVEELASNGPPPSFDAPLC